MPELFNSEHLDISQLTVEQPRTNELTFDVHKELPLEVWVQIEESLQAELKKPNPNPYVLAEIPANMRVLRPDFWDPLIEKLIGKAWEYIDNVLDDDKFQDLSLEMRAGPLANATILNHERIAHLRTKELETELIESLKGYIASIGVFTSWQTEFFASLQRVLILYPEKLEEIRTLVTEEHWEIVKDKLQFYRDQLTKQVNLIHAPELTQTIAGAAFISPERARELIEPKDWQHCYRLLHSSRDQPNYLGFTDLARCMKIITAKSIVIDENCLTITSFDDEFEQSQSDQPPTQRKF